ncbi:hypothetical protein H4582DRAFT_2173393 [Lactarius indigo]|nr:hypothetical protein H4582DRAFT_2173393 [Lactarius indigo]
MLFFARIVAFAFLANCTVACTTTAIVGFCILSYIALTLMPLKLHDCLYHTPFTSLNWYTSQLIPLSYVSFVYHFKKLWYDYFGEDVKGIVKSFHDRQKKRLKSFSDGRVSRLESSAELSSMDIYKNTLARTLNWLTEDPSWRNFNTQHPIRDVLAALPRPTSFQLSLPWSIIQLAQRAITNKLRESVQQRRTQACLRALYNICGAIRDLLARYAEEKSRSSEILPLLNSPESLEIIYELKNTSDDDVALPSRCAAVVVTAYMIITFPTTHKVFFARDNNSAKQFLDGRLGIAAEYHSDSARLLNIVRFLTDIKDMIVKLNNALWVAYEEFKQVAFTQPGGRAKELRLGQTLAQPRVL